MLTCGKLDQRLTIKRKGTTLNSYGEPNHQTLDKVDLVWGGIESITPTERFAAGADQAMNLTKFLVRYRSDLTEDHVIEYDGWRYDISGLQPSGQRHKEYLTIFANRNEKIQ
jgi:SPP1 family predicted phage head-tail adaptor|tara:strand:+ start:216 stop:551 length:336 start_codon:yes stop_codon:yes gene_type:complete